MTTTRVSPQVDRSVSRVGPDRTRCRMIRPPSQPGGSRSSIATARLPLLSGKCEETTAHTLYDIVESVLRCFASDRVGRNPTPDRRQSLVIQPHRDHVLIAADHRLYPLATRVRRAEVRLAQDRDEEEGLTSVDLSDLPEYLPSPTVLDASRLGRREVLPRLRSPIVEDPHASGAEAPV